MKNETAVTSRLSSNMIGKSNDESKFLHNLLSTDRNLYESFANNSSTDIDLLKTQLSKQV